ncbi:hypothetical protein HYT59_02590 [Candidatus Woesebacteria bacterium]|nr:hypothetical protein [Candidatus Woesebacteria bacterium]
MDQQITQGLGRITLIVLVALAVLIIIPTALLIKRFIDFSKVLGAKVEESTNIPLQLESEKGTQLPSSVKINLPGSPTPSSKLNLEPDVTSTPSPTPNVLKDADIKYTIPKKLPTPTP